ncbi:MAG: hypothetical protein NTW33_02370 [Methanoregula sp.]|nr:hypothetical protein [Methanoregula sp.]
MRISIAKDFISFSLILHYPDRTCSWYPAAQDTIPAPASAGPEPHILVLHGVLSYPHPAPFAGMSCYTSTKYRFTRCGGRAGISG